jgi:iron-sulfur cluster assembly protein
MKHNTNNTFFGMGNREFSLPVYITERAREEVKSIMRLKKIPSGYALRLGVRGGGCSGISFVVGFDKKKPGDDVFHTDGFDVLIEKRHVMYLVGLKIDFIDTHTERGFVFLHPEMELEDET